MARLAQAETAHNTAAAPQQDNAAPTPADPTLMDLAHPTAATSEGLHELYFWRDDHTLLFLRRAPDQTVFHAVLVDVATGQQTLPEEFNAKHSALMQGRPMIVTIQGSPKQEKHYRPPTAALSPDGKWLLWRNFPFAQSPWIAATFDGQQQQWTPGSDPASEIADLPNHAFWMPDGTRWVELVSRYADGGYSIHLAHEYRISDAVRVRTVGISGLQDGLSVGIRQDGMVVMHHPHYHRREPVRQLNLSLVSLGADRAVAQSLNVPVPVCNAVIDITLSPKGDRLAWILQQRRERPWLYTLYVADADGAHARPVASAEDVKTDDGHSWPRSVRWLPDGKQVSFVYKGVIHTLPV
jgi:hypothetical protein